MIKKFILGLVGLIILAIFVTVTFVADRVDANFNPVVYKKPYKFTERSLKIFNSLEFVADLHCDALMWQRNLNKKHTYGHVDIPRMQEGNVAFQAFTMVTKSPDGLNFESNNADTDRITKLVIGQGKPYYTWFSLFGRAKHQCVTLAKASEKNEYFSVIGTKKEFATFLEKRQKDKRHVAGFLGAEGGHCLEGRIENLDKLYDLGVRMIGPTHFFDNELGGSAHGYEKNGLTEFGKEVILRMVEKKMIIDIAHSSDKIIADIFEITDVPVISSHTGVDGTCDSPRNLSDDQLRKIAKSGGLVGIAFFDEAVCGIEPEFIAKSMKYVRDLVGISYVALGSDFDGTVTTAFDVTGMPFLVESLIDEGFTEEEISMVMGGNVKTFMENNLPE